MLRTVLPLPLIILNPAPLAAQAPVQWYGQDFDKTLQLAQSRDSMVLLYFWAEGSAHCTSFWNNTLQAPTVEQRLSKLVCFGADAATLEGATLAPALQRPRLCRRCSWSIPRRRPRRMHCLATCQPANSISRSIASSAGQERSPL